MWSADTVDLKNKCYLIEFYNGNLNSIITQKDTFVFFSYILCQQDYQGYKGVLKIENRFIAIFDNKDVGDSYYCRDSLLHIPLNQLPCVFEKFLIRKSFKIVNNSIRQFGGIANDE
jgi:hypothetical protein